MLRIVRSDVRRTSNFCARGEFAMKRMLSAIVLLAATLLIGAASAQIIDLSGRYRCVQFCASGQPGQFAYIAQTGRELNLVDDTGVTWRGYIERPGRIWVHRLEQSAIYS